MQGLIALRLERQAALGIEGEAAMPLTEAEAKALGRSFDSGKYDAVEQAVPELGALYGDHAPAVLTQALQASRAREKEQMAVYAERLFGRITPVQTAPAMDRAAEGDAQRNAFEARPEPARPGGATAARRDRRNGAAEPAPAPSVMPNGPQIRHLIENPDLASAFDAKFGEGTSAQYLANPQPVRADGARFVDGGWLTVGPDGSETWEPAR
jgi:hypothetical protein